MGPDRPPILALRSILREIFGPGFPHKFMDAGYWRINEIFGRSVEDQFALMQKHNPVGNPHDRADIMADDQARYVHTRTQVNDEPINRVRGDRV
jgi:hypothetical protein